MSLFPAKALRTDPCARTAHAGGWVFALLPVVVGFCLPGCQGNQQAYRDLYHRELRLQEDEIYRLEDCIEEYQAVIRGYRIEIEGLKSQRPEPGTREGSGDNGLRPGSSEQSLLDDPASSGRMNDIIGSQDGPSNADAPPIDLPSIDTGVPTEPPLIDAPPIDPPGGAPGPMRDEETNGTNPLDTLPVPPGVEPISEAPRWNHETPATAELPAPPLAGLTVDSYAAPANQVGQGIVVALVRPTNLVGKPTRFQGKASLLLIDPALGVRDGKLARWDFDEREVAGFWRSDTKSPVLDLAIVLPKQVPIDRPLQLWVRLQDEQGNKALRQSDIVLSRLASIDTVKLAKQEPPPTRKASPTGKASPVAKAVPGSNWRRSTRVASAPRAAPQPVQPADSGWKESTSQPKVELASHEEPVEQPVQEKPHALGDSPDWSPER